MGLILVRYGEIALKGGNRPFFLRRLRENIKDGLKRHQISGQVRSAQGRVYVETEQVAQAVPVLSRVFGIVSISPVVRVASDLESIKKEALQLAQRAGVGPACSFRVQARRADKTFPFESPEIARLVGEVIYETLHAPVDLSDRAAVTVGIEVRPEGSQVYGEVIPGPGGLPLNTSGRVVALMSGGIDSPVAAWMMMRRGCGIIPVHFRQNDLEAGKALANCDVLADWAYGWQIKPIVIDHAEIFGQVYDNLRRIEAERWICVFCKRALVLKAAEIAAEYGAHAIVTGENVGQVASQTVENLEIISYGVPKPILRPLIGFDKLDITRMAQEIGTFDISTSDSAPCPYLPDRPLTMARMDEFRAIVDQLERLGAP